MKKLFLLISFCLSFSLQGACERRAAFDLGSGSFKMLVADVNTETLTIEKYIFSKSIAIPLMDDLAKSEDQRFSVEMQQRARDVMHELKRLATEKGAERYSGIATEAFRLALNGEELLSFLARQEGFSIRLIDQIEEANLGFITATSHTKSNPDQSVVWDIGNGSFQMSWKEEGCIHSYRQQIGKTIFKNFIIERVQGKAARTPNPISKEEAAAAMSLLIEELGQIPEGLKAKLLEDETAVYGIGAIHNSNISVSSKQIRYNQETVDKLIAARLNLPDAAFHVDAPEFWVSDLIFVSAIMKHLAIESVINVKAFDDPHVPTTGSTSGILVWPDYW